ncbi:hypothetical protein [Micromonospora sp. NPDC050200]|uniref:hypothetical protein n=1 Tax=Micromonospora sp. NPDC050200 TaxID=3155664 RepID=UPI0033D536FD
MLIATLAITTLSACATTSRGRPCTLIGSPSGVSIGIDPAVAERVNTAEMTVCWNESCQTWTVALYASSRTVSDGCTQTGPGAACSAHAEATAGKAGFVDLADLPSSPVEVTVTLTDSAGARVVDQALMLTPKMTYPNGPGCGAGGPQGRITVGADATARSAG